MFTNLRNLLSITLILRVIRLQPVKGESFMKTKLLMSVSLVAVSACFAFGSDANAQSYWSFGNSVYGSDGFSAYSFGNSVYGNDGYSAYSFGNSVYGNDGYSSYSFGNSTYGNDGYSSYSFGNSTYGSDGTTCTYFGNTMYCN